MLTTNESKLESVTGEEGHRHFYDRWEKNREDDDNDGLMVDIGPV